MFNLFTGPADTADMAHQKRGKFLWFVILLVGGGGLYLNKDQVLTGVFSPSVPRNTPSSPKHSAKNVKTIRQAVRENSLNLQLKAGFRDRKVLSGHFDDPAESDSPPELLPRELVETDSVFREDHNAKALSRDLALPGQEDIYADPENRIRRDLLHQTRLQKARQKQAEQERRLAMEQLVKKAHQGYRCCFRKTGRYCLNPCPRRTQKPDLKNNVCLQGTPFAPRGTLHPCKGCSHPVKTGSHSA